MGLNSSVKVCAMEYDGADKESETKPDVVFLPALVAPGCWAKLFRKSIMGRSNPAEQRVQPLGRPGDLTANRPGER